MEVQTSSRKCRLFPVPFWPGDGTAKVFLYVEYISEFPRDAGGLCAYCHGDPCAEHSGPETLIGGYVARAMTQPWRSPDGITCPCCLGRPS